MSLSPQPLLIERPRQLPLFVEGDLQLVASARDATFQNNKNEPLHHWFPYLEGFGPEFVRSLVHSKMPQARRIIDPFAGSGTTPVALSALGIECGFCEANPVMREITRIKSSIAALTLSERESLADQIQNFIKSLPAAVRAANRDRLLEATYVACFGDSCFFSESTFDSVVRLRTVIESTRSVSQALSDALLLAVLSKLVVCSRLKRAGDVRYKTKDELSKTPESVVAEVQKQLDLISSELLLIPLLRAHSVFLCPDARKMDSVPTYDADGVITSPPYLNGTNYIRNTKLELWFVRLLEKAADLRAYRDAVVTSGINDVAGKHSYSAGTTSVASIVSKLEENAYDQRIPRMVCAYFHDMALVLRGLHAHTRENAVVCIDIGDSRYGGVHVPTPMLLGDIAAQEGFTLVSTHKLRTRLSKDKTPLTQELLTFKKARVRAKSSYSSFSWREKWETFKRDLPHQRLPFVKRNWGNGLHSLCSYHGKMKPALAYHLVNAFSEPGQVVFDPFSGAGTIPFEAALNGRSALAMDISLVSYAISEGKLAEADEANIVKRLDDLDAWLTQKEPSDDDVLKAKAIKFNGPIDSYFHEKTFREIVSARTFFAATRDDSPEWALIFASMLHILHGNRPYALSRRSHPITPFAPKGPTSYKSVVAKLREKALRSAAEPRSDVFVRGKCFQSDALQPWPGEVCNIDAIITSPPFFDSTRFYMTNWMRFWFGGWEREDFDMEPDKFLERQQKLSMDVYKTLFALARDRLREGGVFVLHLGKSRKCDMGHELSQIAQGVFSLVDCFNEDVRHCEKHGVSDKGTVTGHQYLVLQKTS